MAPLATATLSAQLSNQAGRAIVKARNHHVIVDSPPPLGGPNEELNPVDLLLGALATCGVFVCETVARESGLGLSGVEVHVAGEFDPRGVKGEPVDPRIQTIRVDLRLTGITDAEADQLAGAFRQRCPIFTTLVRSAEITLTTSTESVGD